MILLRKRKVINGNPSSLTQTSLTLTIRFGDINKFILNETFDILNRFDGPIMVQKFEWLYQLSFNFTIENINLTLLKVISHKKLTRLIRDHFLHTICDSSSNLCIFPYFLVFLFPIYVLNLLEKLTEKTLEL